MATLKLRGKGKVGEMKEEETKVVLDPLVNRRVTDGKTFTQIRILNTTKDRKM